MRRILLLITDLQLGGTPAVVRELAIRLTDAEQVHIEVACLSTWGPVADQIVSAGLTVTALNAGGVLSLPVVARRLMRLILDHQIDTLFSFLVHANVLAALAAIRFPKLRCFQSIQTTQPYPRWHWHVQRLASRMATRIVVPSKSVAHAANEWARVPTRKIVVISNAVDPDDFAEIARSRAQLSDDVITRIGFIGRLDPIKQVADLVTAMQYLKEPICLHIFGEGPERPTIESQVIKLGLQNRVTLHGAIGYAREALHAVDLLVLPSLAEGFGLVLIEAMAAGVVVVATNVPGIRDVVRNGETGVLVSVNAPVQLAEAIDALIADPVRRKAMVWRASEEVRRRFSWEQVLPQYREVLTANFKR